MYGHHRCIGQSNSLLFDDVEAAVLSTWAAGIRLQEQCHRREVVAVLVAEFGTEFKLKREAIGVQRFARAHDRPPHRACAHRVQTACAVDSTLEAGAFERMLHVGGTEFTQRRDDVVAAEVGGI